MLWIVGKIFQDFQAYLEAHNINYGLFWDSSLPLPDNHQNNVTVCELDFTVVNTLADQLADHPELSVSAIMVAGYENYVLPASIIAHYYGVPTTDMESAQAATDKVIMRNKFLAYDGSLTPDYREVSLWQDAEQFASAHDFPLMLKPANLMKSLLITKSLNMADLRANFEDLQSQLPALYQRYSVSQPPKIIIEEFLVGSMHTVAAFADETGMPQIVPGIVDCITGQEIGFDDNFLFSRQLPSRLTPEEQQSIYDCASEGIKALGLKSSPAHVEIILTDKGPRIIEIGARLGGYRARMYEYSLGIDLYEAAIVTAQGQTLNLAPKVNKACAVIELFPETSGNFVALAGKADIERLASTTYVSVKPEVGSLTGPAKEGFKASTVVILRNNDTQKLQQDLDAVRQLAAIRVDHISGSN